MRASDSTIVPWIKKEWVEGMLRTDFYGEENQVITKLELKPYSNASASLPKGTKIVLYGTRG
jgi:hypothetical protein